MNKRTLKFWMGTPAILLVGWAGAANAAVVPDSDHVAKLLGEAKTMAFQLKEDAVAMEGFTRMNVSWETPLRRQSTKSEITSRPWRSRRPSLRMQELRSHHGKGLRLTGSYPTWTS